MAEMINTSMGMSHMTTGQVPHDVQVPLNHVRSIGLLPLKFEREIYDHVLVDQSGRPTGQLERREVDYVTLVKIGGNGTTIRDRVSRYQKGKGDEDKAIFASFKPHYEAWLKSEELPVDGTPLAAWPGISKNQADRLRNMHILTVEACAEMNDASCEHYGMGARALKDTAKAFLLAKDKGAAAREIAELRERDTKREEEMAELRALLKDATEAMKSDEGETAKRGPGRPRKEAA